MSAGATGRAASDAVCDRIRPLEGTGMRTFTDPEPLVWARTEGTRIWDEDGREYLDLYAGFAVATVGYCHPRVTQAIVEQAQTMTHCPSAAPSRVRAELYERLVEIAPEGLERVLLAVTGSTANEMAVQLARAATGRQTVVTFSGTYVGRTVGSVRYAGKRAYREQLAVPGDAQFLPFPDPYRSPWAQGGDPGELALGLLEEMIDDPASGLERPACIVVEPIQGNGGVVVPPAGFLAGLRRLADKAGALLLFDEIQCGFGRSGRMWACEHEGVVPDLMTIGKGIGGGLALAAVLGRPDVMTTWKPDAITSTFLANALNAAAGVAAIDVLREERLVERSARLGARALARLQEGLADAPHIGHVRGRGLFIGLEVVKDREAHEPDPERTAAFVRTLRERGVIVGRGGRFGTVIKLSPALVIDEDDLDAGLNTILEVLT
ncbi:MAG: aspartate aminotransferase family protein [Thermoleophilaceae bacterium]|nr:aspartate aminotransferase family protein [Thermoleophilaceae bacterium]